MSGREDEIVAITSARPPHSDDLDYRMKRYLISMAIRTVCVVLVVVIDSWWRWLFAVGAVFLPYLAVVMANAGGTPRQAGPPPVPTVEPAGPQLTAGRDPITGETVPEGPGSDEVIRTGDIKHRSDS